ncbi:hypothetical protein Sjap_006753 [Stephania japonica]|uniref:F-box domain-containing protein n=1 Tax=Stephania japonica TaxID=461633 RepID=A0AAP0K910_9MAGN
MDTEQKLERKNQTCSIPDDLAIKIVSNLEIWDVCALSGCCRFWRELCSSDWLWEDLCRERWPSLDSSERSSVEGWRCFYIKRHKEMADGANVVANFVKQNSPTKSLEVGDYLRSIEQLYTRGLGFKDVVILLFASKESALLNLVGVHYSIFLLGVPADLVLEALRSCHISERLVCVRWWKLGRWFYGFRLRDESRCRRVSLGDLVSDKEEEVLGVLHRGTIHEVLRVQISVADGPCTLWG